MRDLKKSSIVWRVMPRIDNQLPDLLSCGDNMNLKKNADIESAPRSICPVTGLPILRRPEWTDVLFDTDTDYKATFSVVGDSILLFQASGYATLRGVKNALRLSSEFAAEAIDGDRPYVQLHDWSGLQGASLEARKYYIDTMKKRERLLGLIYYGTSPMFKMSIKLAKRFNILKFDVHVVNDYSEAVKLALKMLSTGKTQPDDSLLPATPRPSADSQKEDKVCPVTGLPITSKPEWTDIDLGEGYCVTFKFIGDRILLTIPRGKAGEHEMANLFRQRARVLEAMLGPEESFFELKDYAGLQGRPSKAARDQITKGIIADKGRIIGFIGYNAPLAVRFAISVGKMMHRSTFPMFIVKDYETAIKEAVEVLKRHGYATETLTHKIVTSPDWSIQFDGFSARFEVIDGDIFHAVSAGFFEEGHLEHVTRLREKVINSTLPTEGLDYVVSGVKDLDGASRKARKLYIDSLKEWYKHRPFQMYIFYGANRFVRAAFNLVRPFLPFKARVVNHLDDAFRIIAEEKSKGIKPLPLPTVRGAVREPLACDQTQQYVEELLHFMGGINWETDGFDDSTEVDPSHPFKPVFDAIELVKNDLDDLSHERKEAE